MSTVASILVSVGGGTEIVMSDGVEYYAFPPIESGAIPQIVTKGATDSDIQNVLEPNDKEMINVMLLLSAIRSFESRTKPSTRRTPSMQLKDRFGNVIPETRTREQVIDDARYRLDNRKDTLKSLVWERDRIHMQIATLNQRIMELKAYIEHDEADLAQEEERGL